MKKRSLGLLALAVILSASLLGCSEPPPFDPQYYQRPYRAHAGESGPVELTPLPTTLESAYNTPPAMPTTEPTLDEPTIRLSLQEVIRLAVANNLAIKVSAYEPGVDKTRIVEAQAGFDPVWVISAQRQITDHPTPGEEFFTPGQSALSTISFHDYQSADVYKTGIKQKLDTGGTVEIDYEMMRNSLVPQRYVFNPYWTSEMVIQVNQPLLQNFGKDANLARIAIAKNTYKGTVLQFRLDVEKQLSDLEEAYWQLVQSNRDLEIQEHLLQTTRGTQDILFKRGQEDVTRLQLRQAEAAYLSRQSQMVLAKADVERQSNKLKSLMNAPEFPTSGGIIILPSEDPLTEPVKFDPKEQLVTALSNRAEIAQQALKIDSSDLVLKAAVNNLLPKMDLVASAGVQGLDKNVNGAVDQMDRFGFIDYTIGVELDIPLGNREARAIWVRSKLQRLEAISQYSKVIADVEYDVREAMLDVQSSWESLKTARKARLAAGDALLAIEQQEPHLPTLSPEFVELKLDQQDKTAQAQRNESEAIARYNIALYTLERAKGTLLPYNDINLDEMKKPLSGW